MRLRLAIAIAIGVAALGGALYFGAEYGDGGNRTARENSGSVESKEQSEMYPVHENITATVFWVGEDADDSNKFIHNRSSAWIEDWERAYGGVDDPENRCDYRPCAFTPRENPFYFALPYNDLDDNGKLKASARNIPWYQESSETILRNRWVKVSFDSKTVYAQWADVGPFGEDDYAYVFGDAQPSAPEAGIDLSPASADYLGVDGRDEVDWQFIEERDVPPGPWREIITE